MGGNSKAESNDRPKEPVLIASLRAPVKDARVHALPCTIDHDGPAAVSTYFMPRACETDPTRRDGPVEIMEAQFRGRVLKGIKAPCPSGTVGLVARESVLPTELADKTPSSTTNRYWSVESEFDSLVLWHHDFVPPDDHCLTNVEEWYQIAKAIHED